MRIHVFRYPSKPLDKQRLFRNMKDAVRLYHSLTAKVSVETKEKTYAVSLSGIVFIETQGRRTIVHTTTDDFESTQTMHHWLKALSMPCFFQPHKSFLINPEHVTDFDHSTIHLYHSQFEAYLTRRRYTQFKESYLLYLEGTR